MPLSQYPALSTKILNVSELEKISAALIDEALPNGEHAQLVDFLFSAATNAQTIKRRALLHLFADVYGGADESRLRDRLAGFTAQCARFVELYGDGPVRVLRAPARITILGEHVDYVSYLPTASLTFASREHDMVMLYRAGATRQVRGASVDDAYPPFDLTEESTSFGDAPDWQSYLYQRPAPPPHWSNYVAGAVRFAQFKYETAIARGFDFLIGSNIPPKGGASSSSALTVLAGAAVRQVNDIAYAAEELARDSGQAEWYVGTRGGAMDHLTICAARRAHALRISYADNAVQTVPLPADDHRWLTFFSHPADKGREVMLAYNERAAVARLLLPAVIEGWGATDPALYQRWRDNVALLPAQPAAVEELKLLTAELPQILTLAEVEQRYPHAYEQCQMAFPALIAERKNHPLHIRERALHHLGEINRVGAAEAVLGEASDAGPAMRALGQLLDDAHGSLRDYYEVSTAQVESLIEVVHTHPQTLGARLMGGGFGGNVLALTGGDGVSSLVDAVQKDFYEPQHRDARGEGAVMISTAGDGLSFVDLQQMWPRVLEQYHALGREAERWRGAVGLLLDDLFQLENSPPVWPVIVAAGRGTRARRTGLQVSKPLAPVAGQLSIVRVLRAVRAAGFKQQPPIVIVSPETAEGVQEALAGEQVHFVMQRDALGTGDAVLCAQDLLQDFSGLALVVWSTQPVLRPETVRRTLCLAQLFPEFKMFVPTALKERPYAPLLRDNRGRVQAARETHLEQAQPLPFGETNIGLFAVDCQTMLHTLRDLRQSFWQADARRYNRPGGELGFPNEMINQLSRQAHGVLASPIADAREEQGIKSLADVVRCEQYIESLRRAK